MLLVCGLILKPAPEQTVSVVLMPTGSGLIVIITSTGVPTQSVGLGPFGVILYVAVKGEPVVFVRTSVIVRAFDSGTSVPVVP